MRESDTQRNVIQASTAEAHRAAVAELRKNAGTQFDPLLVETFIGVLESQQKEAVA